MRIWIEIGRYAINIGRLNMISDEPVGFWLGRAVIPAGRFAPRFEMIARFIIPGTGGVVYSRRRGEPVD